MHEPGAGNQAGEGIAKDLQDIANSETGRCVSITPRCFPLPTLGCTTSSIWVSTLFLTHFPSFRGCNRVDCLLSAVIVLNSFDHVQGPQCHPVVRHRSVRLARTWVDHVARSVNQYCKPARLSGLPIPNPYPRVRPFIAVKCSGGKDRQLHAHASNCDAASHPSRCLLV